LLGNKQAAELLARIGTVLARWEAICDRLRATHSPETGWVHTGHPTKDYERLEVKRARYIASNVVLIRHHCAEAARLHAELLDCARNGWRIINRPNDVCCGPCPTMIQQDKELKPCGTLLYAEEGATGVQCYLCHTNHSVETLRDMLKQQVSGMLFTRAELVNLMATRLNDPIKQTTFGKYVRTKRLQPREIRRETDDDGNVVEIPMYTYDDVCAARAQDNRRSA
jgi:LSD1 subclass zinc finger protein